MRYLIVLALILLAQQPTKPPELDRATETGSPQMSRQLNSARGNNTSFVGGTSSANQTENGDKHTPPADEDIKTQRKLVLFTGLLVAVGFVTAGVIFWQSWETRKAAQAATKNIDI